MSRHQEGEHLRTGDDLSAGQAPIIQVASDDAHGRQQRLAGLTWRTRALNQPRTDEARAQLRRSVRVEHPEMFKQGCRRAVLSCQTSADQRLEPRVAVGRDVLRHRRLVRSPSAADAHMPCTGIPLDDDGSAEAALVNLVDRSLVCCHVTALPRAGRH